MPDKIALMNQRKLVCKVTRRFTCHDCELTLHQEMKNLQMRYSNTGREILVPYYWLHKLCTHAHGEGTYLKSVYEGIATDGKESGQAGASPTP